MNLHTSFLCVTTNRPPLFSIIILLWILAQITHVTEKTPGQQRIPTNPVDSLSGIRNQVAFYGQLLVNQPRSSEEVNKGRGRVRKLFLHLPTFPFHHQCYDIDNKRNKFQAMFNEHIFYTNKLKRAYPSLMKLESACLFKMGNHGDCIELQSYGPVHREMPLRFCMMYEIIEFIIFIYLLKHVYPTLSPKPLSPLGALWHFQTQCKRKISISMSQWKQQQEK